MVVSTTTGVALQILVFLDLPQDLDAGHVGQIEIEQDQQRVSLVVDPAAVAAEQIIHGGCTVGERHDLIVDAGTPDIPLDQAGVAFVVLDHDDGDWGWLMISFRLWLSM